jgi:hypothetical protein
LACSLLRELRTGDNNEDQDEDQSWRRWPGYGLKVGPAHENQNEDQSWTQRQDWAAMKIKTQIKAGSVTKGDDPSTL